MKYVLVFVALLSLAGCQSQQQSQQQSSAPPPASTAAGDATATASSQTSGGANATAAEGGQVNGTSPSAGAPSSPAAHGSEGAPTDNLPGHDAAMGDSGSDGDEQLSASDAALPSGHDESGANSAMEQSGAGAMTDAEHIEVLDGQLNESFATFDAMILGERAAVAAIADSLPASATSRGGSTNSASDGSGSSGGGPLFEEGDLSEPGGPPGTSDEEAGDGEHAGSGRPASTADSGVSGRGQGHGSVPPDLVDGSDDDIVARQIREAAMNEPDPELREKLWDEYRKYKKGS